jgi:hypothetical protein
MFNSLCLTIQRVEFCVVGLHIPLLVKLCRVLRRILGPKRDEVTREWRKLHNEELRDLYSSPSIIRIIKSRRMQ